MTLQENLIKAFMIQRMKVWRTYFLRALKMSLNLDHDQEKIKQSAVIADLYLIEFEKRFNPKIENHEGVR